MEDRSSRNSFFCLPSVRPGQWGLGSWAASGPGHWPHWPQQQLSIKKPQQRLTINCSAMLSSETNTMNQVSTPTKHLSTTRKCQLLPPNNSKKQKHLKERKETHHPKRPQLHLHPFACGSSPRRWMALLATASKSSSESPNGFFLVLGKATFLWVFLVTPRCFLFFLGGAESFLGGFVFFW